MSVIIDFIENRLFKFKNRFMLRLFKFKNRFILRFFSKQIITLPLSYGTYSTTHDTMSVYYINLS